MREVKISYEVMSGDFTTPIEIFNTFYYDNDYRYTNFLESVVENAYIGRYSFVTLNSLEEIIGYKDFAIISHNNKNEKIDNSLAALRQRLSNTKINVPSDFPVFSGGYIGYFSYESIMLFEDENLKESSFPLYHFVLPEVIIAFDNIYQKLYIVALGFDESSAADNLRRVKSKLLGNRRLLSPLENSTLPRNFETEYSKEEFLEIIRKTKEYIYAGDIFQAVLSQSLYLKESFDMVSIYRRLRSLNPSPYMFFLSMPEVELIGSSPEILVKKIGQKAILRPIAGTRPRGKTREEDLKLEKDLLQDEKELAEHLMLVDLARNDLGRVSKFGTVKVSDFKKIERYSHVMHIVSEVTGIVDPKYDQLELFFSSFPAGTVSGAPKLRAIEIIDELEKTPRGPYAGAVGYFDFSGNMDFCITIRTIIKTQSGITLRAGAGVVYDSVPEREYEETLNKARALIQIL